MSKRNHTITALLLTAGVALAGCTATASTTGPAASVAPTTTVAPTGTTAAVKDGVVTVEASNFTFTSLPASVPAGTRLALTNTATTELHELVAIKLPAGETRTAKEIMALPEAQLVKFLDAGPPATVLLTPPGGPQIPAVGDGTLAEPGRYVVLCAIPTGVDPAAYLAAAQASNGGPPDIKAGPPHFVHGMFADLVVE